MIRTLQPGMKCGRWTLLAETGLAESGEITRKCRCDCGTERYVLERALKYESSRSCGCSRKASASAKDLQGLVFGELTVLGKAENQARNGGVWWVCQCTCGELYETPATLLLTGKRTRCSGKAHSKNYASADITGQRVHMLTAMYPTEKRDSKGSVIWHCRCDCGKETELSYNALLYGNTRSCGCRKHEHEQHLSEYISFVDNTSIDHLASKTIPKNNTTGVRGVYFIRGKYIAKIVIQQKQYYLGTYNTQEEAAAARKEAEETVSETVLPYYEQWKRLADQDPAWAAAHPVHITVNRDDYDRLCIDIEPPLANMQTV